MISICICSTRPALLEAVKINIAETIGCSYEIIAYDNKLNSKGICAVNNECAERAVYPYLCFMHEDVRLVTKDWGPVLIQTLQDPKTGVAGVAGSIVKTKATGPAWWSPLPFSGRLNIIQQHPDGSKTHFNENPSSEVASEVVITDGVFMACRKEVWQKFPFDEAYIHGFHFYDMDFCLSVRKAFKNVVVYNILLEHFSEGKNDLTWVQQADYVTKKWEKLLPQSAGQISKVQLKIAEEETEDFYLHRLIENKARKSLLRKYVLRRILNRPFDVRSNVFFLRKWLDM